MDQGASIGFTKKIKELEAELAEAKTQLSYIREHGPSVFITMEEQYEVKYNRLREAAKNVTELYNLVGLDDAQMLAWDQLIDALKGGDDE